MRRATGQTVCDYCMFVLWFFLHAFFFVFLVFSPVIVDSSLEPEIGVDEKKYDDAEEVNNDENAGR